MKTDFQVHVRIQKPAAEVFDAVVNPKKLSRYFVGTASGPLEEGKQVMWEFTEHPGAFPVQVSKIVSNQMIRLEWDGSGDGYATQIEMTFRELGPNDTLIGISESGWRQDDNGITSSYRNCGGWMHMALCMKAYLDHGINLRQGSVWLG